MSPRRRFVFRLARALGEVNPDAMLARIPARLLTEWARYYRLEPWGEDRADLRAAIGAWTTYAGAGLRPRRKVVDFLAVRPKPERGDLSHFHKSLLAMARSQKAKQ